jgi:hypothetical protein
MKQQVAPRRSLTRRNMFEMNPNPLDFKIERQRPKQMAIAIPPNHSHRRPQLPNLRQNLRLANIPEMPNHIRASNRPPDMRRKPIMRIGNNGNAHFPD